MVLLPCFGILEKWNSCCPLLTYIVIWLYCKPDARYKWGPWMVRASSNAEAFSQGRTRKVWELWGEYSYMWDIFRCFSCSLFVQEGEFWWVSGGTSEDGVTDLSSSQVVYKSLQKPGQIASRSGSRWCFRCTTSQEWNGLKVRSFPWPCKATAR